MNTQKLLKIGLKKMNNAEKNHYVYVHRWLRNNFGTANKCESINCNKTSNYYEWALIHGKKYEFNKDNFIQLCHSCHKQYDYGKNII